MTRKSTEWTYHQKGLVLSHSITCLIYGQPCVVIYPDMLQVAVPSVFHRWQHIPYHTVLHIWSIDRHVLPSILTCSKLQFLLFSIDDRTYLVSTVYRYRINVTFVMSHTDVLPTWLLRTQMWYNKLIRNYRLLEFHTV